MGGGRYGNVDFSGKYFKEMVGARLGGETSRMWRTQRLWDGGGFGDLAPTPQGSGHSPFPGRGLCQVPEAAHPHPGHVPRPRPLPADAAVHTVYYCSLSASPTPRLGRACRLAAGQEPSVSLWAPASSRLISAWTPLPGSGHSGTWYPPRLPHSLYPTAPRLSPLPPRDCTPAGWRSEPQLVSRGEKWLQKRQKLGWGASMVK